MSENTKHPLKYRAVCNVCHQISYAPPLDIPIIGQGDVQIEQYIMATLVGHLQSKHPDEWAQVASRIKEFAAFLACAVFELQDPAILQRLELARYALHTATRKAQITDEIILDRLARVGLAQKEIDAVAPLIRDMRDALTEEGAYKPEGVKDSNLVTA
jgi:hypothetical protein